jgi:hypothetical protein
MPDKPKHNGDAISVSLHAPGRTGGDLSILQRLQSFQDLLRHGQSLLGETTALLQQAETMAQQIAAEKEATDRLRGELEEARAQANNQAEAANRALGQVEAQSKELAAMREELVQARSAVERFQEEQIQGAKALEDRLEESRKAQSNLETELARVRTAAPSVQVVQQNREGLVLMEKRLQATEDELKRTRHELESERARRNRMMALVKPKQVEEHDESAAQKT